MQHFTKLQVWQRSHQLVLGIYRTTFGFPAEERFGLVSQLRRAAVSMPTNIAEGSKRQGSHDYARFLNISEGSLAETEYLLMLSRDLGYLGEDKSKPFLAEVSEIARMLCGLREKVEAPRAE
jgi:four helix bundle protein